MVCLVYLKKIAFHPQSTSRLLNMAAFKYRAISKIDAIVQS